MTMRRTCIWCVRGKPKQMRHGVSSRTRRIGRRCGARGPGTSPPVPVGPGDLLVRVRVNGRGWVQRARLGNGDQPHARVLEAFNVGEIEPFLWIPDAQLHPPQHLEFDLTEVAVHEPARAIHRRISRFWPSSETQPLPVVRLNAGGLEFLSVGMGLTVVPAGKKRSRRPGFEPWWRQSFPVTVTRCCWSLKPLLRRGIRCAARRLGASARPCPNFRIGWERVLSRTLRAVQY